MTFLVKGAKDGSVISKNIFDCFGYMIGFALSSIVISVLTFFTTILYVESLRFKLFIVVFAIWVTHTRQIKQNQEQYRSLVAILDMMVEKGSSLAFYMRESLFGD